MYRGRKSIGDELLLSVQTATAAGVPSLPAASPTARVYDNSGTLVLSKAIPVADSGDVTGLFAYTLFLDGRFSTGAYSVIYRYSVSGDVLQQTDTFDVIAGGQARGTVFAMYDYRRPEADILIEATSGGQLTNQRNPR